MEVQNNPVDKTIPTNVLDDLCSRFIINVPEEERKDLIRLCFQVEQAHWFYIDFYCKKAKKTIGIKEFARQVFHHIPSLHQYKHNVDKIIDEWKEYKYLVPTFGAILLDDDLTNVLLVQSCYSRSSWSFPKGKVNKDEPPWGCAIREVYEETGFNIKEWLDPNEYLDARVNDQFVRLYIIPGVSKYSKFQPMTRNEIKSVDWFPLVGLPATKKDLICKGPGSETFYMVKPFIGRLRQWIYDRYNNKPLTFNKKPQRVRHNSCSDLDSFGHKDYPSTKFLKNVKEIKNKSMSELGNNRLTFKTLSQELAEDNSTSPSEEEVRNSSPECKQEIKFKHNLCQNSDLEKLLLLFPNLTLSDKKDEKKLGKEIVDRRGSSSDIDVKEKPKFVEMASFFKAFEQLNPRSCSVPPLPMTCSCDNKINCVHVKSRRVKRKMDFESPVDEFHLLPISETDKFQDLPLGKANIKHTKPLKFNKISLSESITNHGINQWCNFKFDLQSILKCIDEIKA